jgi:uroporphyrin-III C-methyltransferase
MVSVCSCGGSCRKIRRTVGALPSTLLLFGAVVHQYTAWSSALSFPPLLRPSVSLVGAGPGSPEFLTLRAHHVIKTADVVIADRLLSDEVLELVSGNLLMVPSKKGGDMDTAQATIYAWVKEAVKNSQSVARLKIGDPFLYGRGGEEVEEYSSLLPLSSVTVIPGVSSALAAPLLAGIPLTHRGIADSVIISTGHGQAGERTDLPPYHPLRSAVFLMAVSRLEELCDDLQSGGWPAACPCAVVESAGTPSQRSTYGTCATIASAAREIGVRAPAVLVMGECVTVRITAPPP